MSPNPYTQHLDKNPANYQPLTPLSFLERAAAVFPGHTAVIHGSCGSPIASSTPAPGGSPRRWRRTASAPAAPCRSCSPNTPPMLEAHYGCR